VSSVYRGEETKTSIITHIKLAVLSVAGEYIVIYYIEGAWKHIKLKQSIINLSSNNFNCIANCSVNFKHVFD
jgi:hypothetical protein